MAGFSNERLKRRAAEGRVTLVVVVEFVVVVVVVGILLAILLG
jgi:hypothetical protein